MAHSKKHCEYLRYQAKNKFNQIRGTWIDCGLWTIPYRVKWLLSQTPGERNNRHIVDTTHILAQRSMVAGFLEGNTSATRPWIRYGAKDPDLNQVPENRDWLKKLTSRCLNVLTNSNFYDAVGTFYYDYSSFNTGMYYVDEREEGLFFHNVIPGSAYILNDYFGEPTCFVQEMSLSVKQIVSKYAKYTGGVADWSNISANVRKMYEDGNYSQLVDVIRCVYKNDEFDPMQPMVLMNKPWLSLTYELGGSSGPYYQDGQGTGFVAGDTDPRESDQKFLAKTAAKRKPFIVGKSQGSQCFEYGEQGPTLAALGTIKSLNKKAISKDQALELMLRPPIQGPASVKKSYLTTAPNSYVPLDAAAMSKQGLRTVYEVNPGVVAITSDVAELRRDVDRHYFADFLLYLSRNPKTRTATETDAVVEEQQRVIGPNLQALNWTHNQPIAEYVLDYVLFEDPFLPPPPPGLVGQFLRPEFVSVFAQSQRAADLPQLDRFKQWCMEMLPLDPKLGQKIDFDAMADVYADRLYIPEGIARPQAQVDAMREQAMQAAQRQQMLTESLPAVAGAMKDANLKVAQ